MRYYTAIGRVLLDKREGYQHPLVWLGDKEVDLSVGELMLWSILAGAICTYEEIKCMYETRQVQLQFLFPDFDGILERLICRGLVATGESKLRDDALFQLLEPYQMCSCQISFLGCCKEFLEYILINRMPVSVAVLTFQKTCHSKYEKYILHLLKGKKMNFQEIIRQAGTKYDQKEIVAGIAGLYIKGLVYLV